MKKLVLVLYMLGSLCFFVGTAITYCTLEET